MTLETKPFGDIVTFTRASEGGRFNALGQYEMVPANVPRLDHDPVTLQPLGIRVEEQRTNLLLNSATLSTQAATVTAAPTTLSFTGTGTVTLSGAFVGALVGTGANNRVSLTFTPPAGSLTLTVTGSVTRAQLETGAFATSYIPTLASQITRAADVCSVNTLSPWYNALEGSLVVEFVRGSISPSQTFATLRGAVNSTMTLESGSGAPGQLRLRVNDAGTQQAIPIALSSSTAGVPYKLAGAYRADYFAVSVNGQPADVDTSGTVPTVTRMEIGNVNSVAFVNGAISRLTYYPRVIDVQQASATFLPDSAILDENVETLLDESNNNLED